MIIEIEVKHHYGIEHFYVCDPILAESIATLTDKKCINHSEMVALRTLGCEIWLVMIDGKAVKAKQI
jgi:hypothetical protein